MDMKTRAKVARLIPTVPPNDGKNSFDQSNKRLMERQTLESVPFCLNAPAGPGRPMGGRWSDTPRASAWCCMNDDMERTRESIPQYAEYWLV
jgi:hypothetical protein